MAPNAPSGKLCRTRAGTMPTAFREDGNPSVHDREQPGTEAVRFGRAGFPHEMNPVTISNRLLIAMLLLACVVGCATAPKLSGAREPDSIAGLSVIERDPIRSPDVALILSGDGGWRRIDRAIAARIEERGIPIVGWNMSGYLSRQRSPEEVAEDLARVMRHSIDQGAVRFLLVGYSRGADALPIMINRLPPSLRRRIVIVALLAPSRSAALYHRWFHWLFRSRAPRYAILPEIEALSEEPVLCIHGTSDHEAVCPAVPAGTATVISVQGGHHFAGKYRAIADRILTEAGWKSSGASDGSEFELPGSGPSGRKKPELD